MEAGFLEPLILIFRYLVRTQQFAPALSTVYISSYLPRHIGKAFKSPVPVTWACDIIFELVQFFSRRNDETNFDRCSCFNMVRIDQDMLRTVPTRRGEKTRFSDMSPSVFRFNHNITSAHIFWPPNGTMAAAKWGTVPSWCAIGSNHGVANQNNTVKHQDARRCTHYYT